MILEVLPVLEAVVRQHNGRDVVATHAEAVTGCYSGGYAAQPAIPDKNAWQSQRPPQVALHACSFLTLHVRIAKRHSDYMRIK